MAFALTEFKSNLKGGGARSSLFNVTLRFPSKVGSPDNSSLFLVKSATLPGSTIGTYEVFFHGKGIKVAGDRTFETWDTTIINDENFGIRRKIEEWMNLISNHKLNIRDPLITGSSLEGEDASYKQDMTVSQYGKSGNKITHYHFLGCFPSAMSTIPLDWGSADIEEFTVTWTYDRWGPGKSVGDIHDTDGFSKDSKLK